MQVCGGDSRLERLYDDIIYGVMNKYSSDTDWVQYMLRNYPGLSKRILNQKIKQIELKYQEITGRPLPTAAEIKMFKKYEQYLQECDVLICRLQDNDWYLNYFHNVFDRAHLRDIIAHNGILCGDSSFFLRHDWNTYNLGVIVLLQDKYRPGVDVARLGIRELSLEMSCDFTLIKDSLDKEGFSIVGNPGSLLKNKPWMIPTSMYDSLLKKRPDLENRLVFDTDKGRCGCSALKELVSIHKRLCLKNIAGLVSRDGSNYTKDMLNQLRVTYLKQNYDLHMELRQYHSEIYITEKGRIPTGESSDIFPAALFLYSETECKYLAKGDPLFRCFCNADHRFSKFILKNGPLLHQKVPGILKEIIRVLQEDPRDKLVQTVSDLLTCLRNLPGWPIEIPDDIFLTTDDFC